MPETFSVLIVEDDENAVRNMEDILSMDGYRTRQESGCLAAAQAIESERFDAIIMKWRLPDQNADSLFPVIRKEQPETPVVVVTGFLDFDASLTALRGGVFEFLLKPVDDRALRATLAKLVVFKRDLHQFTGSQAQHSASGHLVAIGQMAADVSHESRNALQRSHACLNELSLELENAPECLLLVNKAQLALDDLHKVLEDIREYSAPILLDRRDVCLKTLVREVWLQLPVIGNSDCPPKMNMEISDDFPPTCIFDGIRLRQVIRHLFMTALYANGFSGPVQVRLGPSDHAGEGIRIEIDVSGFGSSASGPVRRLGSFSATSPVGTGLGLGHAISLRIVHAHGGRIFMESLAQGETRFVVELPEWIQ